MREITVEVEPSVHAPRISRRRLNELRAALEPRFGDVALVVSELVTNSVRHGDGSSSISVEVEASPDHIRVEVVDQGPCFPKSIDRKGGMGLDIIDQIADRWGVDDHGGCRVWVEIAKTA